MTNEPSYLFYQPRSPRPFLDRGEGIYLFDESGNRYIDGSSGAMVSNIGHSNPRVLAKMKAQMDKATFGYRLHFRTHPSEDLAAKTVAMTPEGLDRVFFVSGGSEAVETAIKLARQYALTQGQGSRHKVISRFPSYHGCTLGALDLAGYAPLRDTFAAMMAGMPRIAAPATYLDRDNLSDAERGLKYAELLRDKIKELGPDTVLAFVMEPIGGASTGALLAPDSYYGRVREICDEYGVLLIYDEVMIGAGRTGKFLAAEHWGITPDIVTMSKGFGAGYAPLGAIIAGARLVEPVLAAGGFAHGFTYAGNPLACAAGDLANWKIPGKFSPGVGGGIELAQKARRVVVLTTHTDRAGNAKLKQDCSLPLTARACVSRIFTDMAVIDVTADGFVLVEVADGVSIAEVVAATDAPLSVPDAPLPIF